MNMMEDIVSIFNHFLQLMCYDYFVSVWINMIVHRQLIIQKALQLEHSRLITSLNNFPFIIVIE